MTRPLSRIAPDWWDYTTLDAELIREAAALSPADLERLSRPGFRVLLYDTLEDFFLAEALEYISAWRQATADAPAGICGMDEWYENGREVPVSHPLSFERADRELCFDRIRPDLRMPESNLHFPKADTAAYVASWDAARCVVMQGGQGDIKHWAFNDPPRRGGRHQDAPPAPAEYRALSTRVVDLHPVTLAQNARTSGGGNITMVPMQAITVGPLQTWRAEKISIWQAGMHDNPLGQRLTALMISRRIVDTSVPMSLLADHPQVQFNYYRGGLGSCAVEMH
jgi:glucosamine-6-phosphate deaminase